MTAKCESNALRNSIYSGACVCDLHGAFGIHEPPMSFHFFVFPSHSQVYDACLHTNHRQAVSIWTCYERRWAHRCFVTSFMTRAYILKWHTHTHKFSRISHILETSDIPIDCPNECINDEAWLGCEMSPESSKLLITCKHFDFIDCQLYLLTNQPFKSAFPRAAFIRTQPVNYLGPLCSTVHTKLELLSKNEQYEQHIDCRWAP